MNALRSMRLHTAIGGPEARPGNAGRGVEVQPWV